MIKKIFYSIIAATIALALVSCGTPAVDTEVELKSENAQIQTNGADNSLSNVLDERVLKIGVFANNEPFTFKNKNGEISGYDIDLAKSTASLIGVVTEFVEIPSGDGVAELESGKVDVIWSGCKVEPEAEDKVLFSVPYITTTHIIVVPSKSEATFKEKLDGAKVGILVNCNAAGILENDDVFSKLEKKDILTFYDTPTALAYLRNNQMEALILDEFLYSYYVKNPSDYMVLEDKIGTEEYAVASKADAKELIREIDSSITKLKENGKLKEIHDKWFGNEE